MDGLLRALGLLLFGVGMTWLITVVLARFITRKGFAFWVWDRSGSIGRILIFAGFGLALVGLGQGPEGRLLGTCHALPPSARSTERTPEHARPMAVWQPS